MRLRSGQPGVRSSRAAIGRRPVGRNDDGRRPIKREDIRLRSGVRAITAVLAAGVLVGGCSFRERICESGHYPVKAVGSTTGRTCVPDGDRPPAGYVKYPEGKVPKYVDDEWDRYWSEHMLDADGREIPA